ESDVIPFARAAKDAVPNDPDQLDEAGQTILQYSTERLELRKKTADARWRRRKSFGISCAQLKTGLRSWKQRSLLIRKEPAGPSSGSIAFTRRLKIDFCGRITGAAVGLARRNGPAHNDSSTL